MKTMSRALLAALIATLVPGCVDMDETGEGGADLDRRPPPPPPPAAVEACADLEAGTPCAFELDGQILEGICWAPAELTGVPLACAPDEVRND